MISPFPDHDFLLELAGLASLAALLIGTAPVQEKWNVRAIAKGAVKR
jgi:hypothetical protein